MRPMDRWARPTLQPQLIACHYVRYALIRTLVYTTDPAEAEHIAACALAKACLASRRLGGMADPGLLVELLLESVARSDKRQVTGDKEVIGDRREAISSQPGAAGPHSLFRVLRVFRGLESLPDACGLRSEACFRIAEVLNGMRRFARDLLILHYIEGLSRAELGEIHRVAVGRVRIALAEARLDFIERLGEHEGSVCDAHPAEFGDRARWTNGAKPDVRGVLMGLAGVLNQESVRIVGEIVRQFLTDIE
jgi:DNA-directed RNA polymerase specialized sigma24 family protein